MFLAQEFGKLPGAKAFSWSLSGVSVRDCPWCLTSISGSLPPSSVTCGPAFPLTWLKMRPGHSFALRKWSVYMFDLRVSRSCAAELSPADECEGVRGAGLALTGGPSRDGGCPREKRKVTDLLGEVWVLCCHSPLQALFKSLCDLFNHRYTFVPSLPLPDKLPPPQPCPASLVLHSLIPR